MMNTSAKGRSYEWEVRHKLEAQGFTVMRSAASKGRFDLVAWNDVKLGFFQLKRGRFSCLAAERLVSSLPRPYAADVVVVHECRKGCRYALDGGHVPERFCMHRIHADVRRE